MEILFQCNTVYQLLVVTKMRTSIFKNDKCDLIISDRLNNSKTIAEKFIKAGIFDNVYHQNIKNVKFKKIEKIFSSFKTCKKNDLPEEIYKKNYDGFYFANPHYSNIILFKYLLKNNKKLELGFFEDGLITYTKYYENLFVKNAYGLKAFFNKNNYLKKSKKIFTFLPEVYSWNPSFEIIKLEPLLNLSKEIIQKLNYVFDYNINSLPKDCKTIFFEESYFGDGKEIGDVDIINKCFYSFGSEGFYLKNHPRNQVNRFKDANIKTFPSNSIPWELIVLNNMDRTKNINLITISSQTIFTPVILLGIKPKCFLGVNLVDRNLLYPYIPELEINIANKYENFIFLEKMLK